MKNKRSIFLAIGLMFSIFNFNRISGNENIRTIEFLSIFTIGALTALLIQSIAKKINGE